MPICQADFDKKWWMISRFLRPVTFHLFLSFHSFNFSSMFDIWDYFFLIKILFCTDYTIIKVLISFFFLVLLSVSSYCVYSSNEDFSRHFHSHLHSILNYIINPWFYISHDEWEKEWCNILCMNFKVRWNLLLSLSSMVCHYISWLSLNYAA